MMLFIFHFFLLVIPPPTLPGTPFVQFPTASLISCGSSVPSGFAWQLFGQILEKSWSLGLNWTFLFTFFQSKPKFKPRLQDFSKIWPKSCQAKPEGTDDSQLISEAVGNCTKGVSGDVGGGMTRRKNGRQTKSCSSRLREVYIFEFYW